MLGDGDGRFVVVDLKVVVDFSVETDEGNSEASFIDDVGGFCAVDVVDAMLETGEKVPSIVLSVWWSSGEGNLLSTELATLWLGFSELEPSAKVLWNLFT